MSHVQTILNAFEEEWAGGTPPPLDDYVVRVCDECPSLSEQSSGFRQLLAIELRYRRERGEEPDAQSLSTRFPERKDDVAALFSDARDAATIAPSIPSSVAENKSVNPSVNSSANSGATVDAAVQRAAAKLAPTVIDSEGHSGNNDIPPNQAETIDDCQRPVSENIVSAHAAATIDDLGPIPGNSAAERADRDISAPSGPMVHSRHFGDYLLLEEIARGGMGVVFKARQKTLNRTVAVKMILAGQFADRASIERFYTEAEAAGQLEHPGIVPVYEVGNQDGFHFFSMAYINGKSLSDRVKIGPLTPQEAAAFLVKIARAVAYAHSHGVVHRDLKPANILIDQSGEPRITDFGLAKMDDQNRELTASGQIMGTPGYMAPEQAGGYMDRVGPLSDVYSLGAVLYCLLTGRPPFQSARLVDTLRQVQEQEPVPPRHLNNTVSLDLENICLKTLSKEAERRYASANELADDLQRFLDGRPVLARPIGRLPRIMRWCKRNPLVAGSIAAVVLSLVIGTVVSTSYAIEANRQLQVSEARLRQLRAAVDNLYTKVSEDTLLNQPGFQKLRKELLAEALDYYRGFVDEGSDDPDVQDELALNHFRVGLITEQLASPAEALTSYATARRMQSKLFEQQPSNAARLKALADTLTAIGRVHALTFEHEKSLAVYREALAIRERVAGLRPDDFEIRRVLANSYMNPGIVLRQTGELAQAHDAMQQAQDMRRALMPQLTTALVSLPSSGTERDDRQALMLKLRRDMAQGEFNLGGVKQEMNDPAAAREHFERARTLFDEILRDEPEDLDNQFKLTLCNRVLGDLYRAANDFEPAILRLTDARRQLERLVLRNPDVSRFRFQLAGIHVNLGELQHAQGHPEALDCLQAAADLFGTLSEEAPDNPDYLFERALVERSIGAVEHERNDIEAARGRYESSRDLLTELLTAFPDDAGLQEELSATEAAIVELD